MALNSAGPNSPPSPQVKSPRTTNGGGVKKPIVQKQNLIIGGGVMLPSSPK